MNYLRVLALSALGALLVPATGAAAPDVFVDQICNDATVPVRDFNVKTKDPATSLDQGIEATERVILAYLKCAGEKQRRSGSSSGLTSVSDNSGAEGMHYAQVRAAQFQLSLGRLLTALRRYDDARIVFDLALANTKDTLDWQAPAVQSYSSNYVTVKSGSSQEVHSRNSEFRSFALTIHDQLVAERDKLPKPQMPVSGTPDK